MYKSYLIPWLLMATSRPDQLPKFRVRQPRSKTFPQRTVSRSNCSTPCPRKSLALGSIFMDDKNRIIASDQFGGLYRFPAPKAGKTWANQD